MHKIIRAHCKVVYLAIAMIASSTPASVSATQESTDPINNPFQQSSPISPYKFEFETINPRMLNLELNFKDIEIPGNGGLDIAIERSYGDKDPYYSESENGYSNARATAMGDFWDINIPALIFLRGPNSTDLPTYSTKSGCQIALETALGDMSGIALYAMPTEGRAIKTLHRAPTSETQWSEMSSDNWKAECITSSSEGPSGRVVYSPDGRRYVFNYRPPGSATWFPTRISDKNGNWIQYNYGAFPAQNWPLAPPLLNSITTSDGRTVNFNYTSIVGRLHITSIVTSGTRVDYEYEVYSPTYCCWADGAYPGTQRARLKRVVRPDGTAWSFSYQSSTFGDVLSSLATPSSGVISYTYGIWGGIGSPLATKTVSGSLPPATWSFAGYEYLYPPQVATITGPQFCSKTTFHLGTPTPDAYIEFTANLYGTIGTIRDYTRNTQWNVGLTLVSDTYDDSACSNLIRRETTNWDKRIVSSGRNIRECESMPGTVYQYDCKYGDANVYSPYVVNKAITQDSLTYTTSYSGFDSYGNPQYKTESGSNGGVRTKTTNYYNNTSKWIIGAVQSESFTGSALSRTFDANGNLTSTIQDGVTNSYTYDAQGNVASVTKPRGLLFSFSNYKRGIAQNESQPEGITISRVVSDLGKVTSETNGDGYTTTYIYDSLGRQTGVTYPTGTSTSIGYTAVAKTATRGSLVETTQFDGLGRASSITLGGITTSYTYNPAGQVSYASDPGGATGTSFQYDALGRLTRTNNADGTFSTTTYGPASRTVTDERGNATTYSYRSYGTPDLGWIIGITTPNSAANVSIARNSKDLVTSVTQGGLTRTYGYNSNYYLISITDPETGTTSYGRDAAGNMTTRSVGGSGTSYYTYDGHNRLSAVTFPGSTPAVSNTYNKRHQLVTSNSSAANRSHAYDANGNLTSETVVIDGLTFTTGYSYNGLDQLISTTYPRSGNTISYQPDALGRPTQVSGYVSSVSYWPSGLIKQINYANGTITNYNQSNRLWPSSFSTQKTGVFYINSTYGYDGAGNLTSITDSVDNSYNRSIGYDNLNRLISVSGPWGAGSVSYNGVGNIVNQVFGSFSLYYSYDANNRLGSVSGSRATSYTYDAYGNIATGSGKTFAYDGVPNLQCVSCADNANKIQYAYDGTNRRVSVLKGGIKQYEVYGSHGNQLIEFVPAQSNKLTEYIYLGGKRVAQRVSP